MGAANRKESGERLMEFRILGPIEVLDDGTPIELGAPKQRAVLAVLLLHVNEVVSADRLVDLVWGEDPPRTAAHSVQIYVSELRKAFDADGEVIVTRRPGYVLQTEPEMIDARRFEALVGEAISALRDGDQASASVAAGSAIGLWSGSPLADFAYDDFAQREIERLTELHHRAVATLCELHVFEGRPLEAVPMLRDSVRADPLREEPRRLLMLALFAGGRQAEALREFRDYRHRLGEEAGLDPSPELLRLEEQILLRDPSLAPQVEEPTSVRTEERNPYKGLRAFGEADVADFFGRDELVERLLEACSQPLTAVVGPSGSGKSSAVRAGLIPTLRAGAIPGSEDWAIVTMQPGRYPFAEFDAAIADVAADGIAPCDPGDDHALAESMIRCLTGDTVAVLLVVDQFEELFTLTDETTRRAFLRNVANAAEDPRQRIRILITIRADFYDRPLTYPEFIDHFTDSVVHVAPLSPTGIEAAAVEPSRGVGISVDSDLLAQLVSDMSDQPGALPLFQYTLTELFAERDSSTMTIDGYQRIGGLSGALRRRADAVYASLDAAEQTTARDIFLRLVKPTEDRYTRRPVPVLELEAVGDAVAVSAVLTRFGDERLLTFDRDSRTGAATCEVSHEAMLSGWDRLAGWLDDARLDLEKLDGLIIAAADWEAADRDSSYLLTGARLTEYETWSDSSTIVLLPSAAAFLVESVDARTEAARVEVERAERETKATRRSRFRLLGMLAAVVALVAVVTFVVLTSLANRPPSVVLVYSGPDEGGWNDQMVAELERAANDFDIEIGYEISSPAGLGLTLTDLVESGTELILNGFGSIAAPVLSDVVPAQGDTNFVLPDIAIPLPLFEEEGLEYPNASYPWFASHEGSFLVGVAAARMTVTDVVGFIGVEDVPVTVQNLAGFEAGVAYVEEDEGKAIEVIVRDVPMLREFQSAFDTRILGRQAAQELYALGSDVVYASVGASGRGVLEAAYDVSGDTGVHRWYIGVDVDEWAQISAEGHDPDDPYDQQHLLPHILTSMVKYLGPSMYDAVEDFANRDFTDGVIQYGVADHGVDYTTSGGHLSSDLIEELEDLRMRIGTGEIDVPTLPEGYEFPVFEDEG
ncbi:MAG: BTAD domain-containing putative transcriptional regulator [Actinomycetota bacterium]|nr:BTAD domain-containing putative transcriptional regulator [Actinomycetota bacterium]